MLAPFIIIGMFLKEPIVWLVIGALAMARYAASAPPHMYHFNYP